MAEKDMVNVAVLVDVANFKARAFVQSVPPLIPTHEGERILYFESRGAYPKIGGNIYDLLSAKDKRRVNKIAEPISISGIRGTMRVRLERKKLMESLIK